MEVQVMRKYRKRIASSLLNLTPNEIIVHDDTTGDIVVLPTHGKEVAYAFLMHGVRRPDWYFVCEKKDLETIRKLNRSLTDVVVINYSGVCRDMMSMNYLVWAVDCKTPVRLQT